MGTPGPAAKRHHYVPQFHLRGFADGETITTVELPGDRSYNQPVRKAAAENHLYSLPGHPDGADVFEKALSQLEGEVAAIFTDVESGTWPLSEESRGSLAYYVALQMARGPEQRRNMENLVRQATRMEIGYGGRAGVKGWAKKHLGLDVDDATAARLWDEAMRPEGPPIKFSTAAHIEQTLEIAESLFGYMSGRPWSLVRFDKRSLILSDVPVGLVRQPDEEDSWMGVGVMTAWGITFPLTRKLGLLMNDPNLMMDNGIPVEKVRAGAFDIIQAGTTGMERIFNEHTAASASLRLFHHPDDARFVPSGLPDPSPVTMALRGTPTEYTGEPYILPRTPKSNRSVSGADEWRRRRPPAKLVHGERSPVLQQTPIKLETITTKSLNLAAYPKPSPVPTADHTLCQSPFEALRGGQFAWADSWLLSHHLMNHEAAGISRSPRNCRTRARLCGGPAGRC